MYAPNACGKIILAGLLAALPSLGTARPHFKALYRFTGETGDGAYPLAGVIRDVTGNLYGTTFGGGGAGCYDCGTVFKIAPDGTETLLHVFAGGRHDGAQPIGGLNLDKAGNLYGTTETGGNPACRPHVPSNCGTVFEIASDGTESLLYAFLYGSDGAYPYAGVVMDEAGNLYGTTYAGGSSCGHLGCGTVFKLAVDGTESVLYAFSRRYGTYPRDRLIKDKTGNLYGTTTFGGAHNWGTVFKLSADGTETILWSFTNGSDGSEPVAGLIADTAGNLYGTTVIGGAHGEGTVFKLAPDDTETVLHAFTGGSDGGRPSARLIEDSTGNFYGTTTLGGDYNYGAVFKLASDGTETVLYSFTDGSDGAYPEAGLVEDPEGNLYGTTYEGGTGCNGYGCGTVFELTK